MKPFVILFVLLLAGCASGSKSVTCGPTNKEDFEIFFNRWSSDKDFSVARTTFPLVTISYPQDGEETSDAEKQMMTRDEFKSLPLLSQFLKDHPEFHFEIQSEKDDTEVVGVFIPNSDTSYEYHFTKIKGCWTFVEFDNLSV